MKVTRLTTHEVGENLHRALRASMEGPVYIGDDDRASFVLLRRDEYDRLQNQGPNILELLYDAESAHIDFEPPRMELSFVSREADLV